MRRITRRATESVTGVDRAPATSIDEAARCVLCRGLADRTNSWRIRTELSLLFRDRFREGLHRSRRADSTRTRGMSTAFAFPTVRATGASPSRVSSSGGARGATSVTRHPLTSSGVVIPANRACLRLMSTKRRTHVPRSSASNDLPAHVDIIEDSSVHGSSLVSTGLNPKPNSASLSSQIEIQGVHHVAVIVQSMKRSMDFYHRLLGLPINPDRPTDKLPYDGAWLMIGPEMLHLMEVPNPDPDDLEFRPEHGGKDRHFCIGVKNLKPLTDALELENIPYTASRSGRPAIFFRDPDCNTLEVVQGMEWRGENDRNLTLQ